MGIPIPFGFTAFTLPYQVQDAQGEVPFERVEVAYAVRGTTSLFWSINPRFNGGAQPWTFYVQTSPVAVTDPFAWTTISPPLTATNYWDVAERVFGKEHTVFYRVCLVTADQPPRYFVSPPANVYGDLDFHHWQLLQEMVRKELLRLQRLNVGVQGFLLKRLDSGILCTRCTDPLTWDQTDGWCPVCYGQKYVGGYYQAQAQVFVSLETWQNYIHQEVPLGTTDRELPIVQGHFVGMPFVDSFDAWANATSDLRYYLRKKEVVAQLRGVPFLYEVQMSQAPFTDVIYHVPLKAA
jgi:hypothetical protein